MRAARREAFHEDWQRRHRVRATLTLVLALMVPAGVLPVSCGHAARQVVDEALVEESPPEVWATDGEVDAGVIARPMPSKPFKGQKTPPCKGKGEVELAGGCWVALKTPPEPGIGCGPSYFEHAGECYLPVKRAERLPTSMEP